MAKCATEATGLSRNTQKQLHNALERRGIAWTSYTIAWTFAELPGLVAQ